MHIRREKPDNSLSIRLPQGRLPSLSFFFPAHNEELNIRPMVEEALQVLPTLADRFEVLIIDDGSTDGTAEVARELASAHPQVRHIRHQSNRGYGAALKSGIAASSMDWIFFTDGDRQFDLKELSVLVDVARNGADAVIGYRRKRADRFYRSVNALMYKMLVRVVLGVPFRDIDCAFKLMRGELVRSLELESEGALISAEMLRKLMDRHATIWQVGVSHYPRIAGQQSGASLKVIIRMFAELFRLRGRIRAGQRTMRHREAEPHHTQSG